MSAWLSDDGTLTISGPGTMADYEAFDQRLWEGKSSLILNINIENGVTSIGSFAFYGADLASVTIPSSIKTVLGHAFDRCTSLTEVTFQGKDTTAGEKVVNLTFGGTGMLTVNRQINIASGDTNSLTVNQNATLTAKRGIYLGASGRAWRTATTSGARSPWSPAGTSRPGARGMSLP